MYFFAIETSCDETSIALMEYKGGKIEEKNFLEKINSVKVISSIISSQAELFAKYGGVIPEISARNHAEQIYELFELVVREGVAKTGLKREDIFKKVEKIYVTKTPGLMSALRVGIEFAKSIAYHLKAEVVPVNHLYGHIASSFYHPVNSFTNKSVFPHLHLLVSGGNTQIILMKNWKDWQVVAQTLDDAAGECFDKTGRMLGIPYPAGPKMGKIAGEEFKNIVNLPIGMNRSDQKDLSYSGLKTAVRYLVQGCKIEGVVYEKVLNDVELKKLYEGKNLNDKLKFIKDNTISIQTVIIEQLIRQFKKQLKGEVKSIGLSGGVSANEMLKKHFEKLHKSSFLTERYLSGDNAIMIGLVGVLNDFYGD